jgi:GGDEF domain-containing protein
MRGLRWNLVFIVIWFFFLYNIERLIAPINIASFVYVFAAVLAVLIILMPALNNANLWILFAITLIPFFGLKILFNYEIGGTNFSITVTEICAVGVSLGLARQVGKALGKLQDEITQISFGHGEDGTRDFNVEQTQIYREIRHARRYGRPAALMAISASEKSINLALHRFIEGARNNITRKYIASQVAKLLTEELHDSDKITQREDHFIVLLTETNWENALSVVNRLKASAEEKLHVKLNIGLSTFPDEAITFERLLETAEDKMNSEVVSDKKLSIQDTGIPIEVKIMHGRE